MIEAVKSQITSSNDERIVGGLPAQQGQFPFQVKEFSNQLYSFPLSEEQKPIL